MINEVMAGVAGAGIGWLGAFVLLRQPPNAEQIREYMSRIVNLEAIEEHEKLVKVRMMRNKLKTVRVDGGPNARVGTMRLRKRPRMPRG